VEILHGNEVCPSVIQPLRTDQRLTLRAVPIAATIEGDTLVATGITLLDMAPQRRSPATLDRAHDAALTTAERVTVFLAVGRAGLTEDVRQFEPDGTQRQPQKWAGGVGVGGGGSTLGNRSKGLVVAHTVVVATFR